MTKQKIPKHIAIIMDGNGRWAKMRGKPRIAGHKAGVASIHTTIKWCIQNKVEVLTLFAFSSENWLRPQIEVNALMRLFLKALSTEIENLHAQNISVRFIGDRARFSTALQKKMSAAEEKTQNNTRLTVVIAANYGGQWDIAQSCQSLVEDIKAGKISKEDITPELISKNLATGELPNPDLFIRTSNVIRISNFMLWQLAYAELYFTNVFWPDFDEKELDHALDFFNGVERRFGMTGEQVQETI
jgi:undecaprenyl diphosphate synthase